MLFVHAVRVLVLTCMPVLALVLGACGEAEDAQPVAQTKTTATISGSIALTISYDDGAGTSSTSRLTCRSGEVRADGALAGRAPAAKVCAHARGIATLLMKTPPARRACTQIYGGPQTAHVRGRIDGRQVDRMFTRANGCEIADFEAAGSVLPVKRMTATRSP